MAIGGLCAFKPFEMAVRPFGKIFGESVEKKTEILLDFKSLI